MPCSASRAEAVPQASPEGSLQRLQRLRRLTQGSFFALFLLAPSLNLLRFDLHEAQLWVLGMRWTLGIDALARGEVSSTAASLQLVLRGILPPLAVAAAVLAVAWRYGRLYCGWLCPHFSLVETLNDLLHRACGRLSLWDRTPTLRDGRQPDRRWWPLFLVSCAFFGGLWAVTLLTYLLPPAEIWGGLWHGTLSPNQARFLAVAATAFTAELLLARHLFCRFGCAVGFFQSLAWMANPRAMVMAFDRSRAVECRRCATPCAPQGDACEAACPMRLQPRRIKRLMFSCVQCGRCLRECEISHAVATPRRGSSPSLQWVVGEQALRETLQQRRSAAPPPGDP